MYLINYTYKEKEGKMWTLNYFHPFYSLICELWWAEKE